MRDHASYIQNPDGWVMWPLCPLKRRDNSLERRNLGFLMATEEHAKAVKGNGPFTIFHCYVFDVPESLKDTPTTEYASLEEMLADGWIVD